MKTKNPMQTHSGKIKYKAYSIDQLKMELDKTKTPKIIHKIQTELNRKNKNLS